VVASVVRIKEAALIIGVFSFEGQDCHTSLAFPGPLVQIAKLSCNANKVSSVVSERQCGLAGAILFFWRSMAVCAFGADSIAGSSQNVRKEIAEVT
jgi:hypothetical protein